MVDSVRIGPSDERNGEVLLRVEDNGLNKPLARCKSKELGSYGEELASLYLESLGLRIRERNWRCSFGEVDIIAEDDETLVLAEVKTRTTSLASEELAPELAVTARKQSRYQKLALVYLSWQTRFDAVRFDVIGVKLIGEREALVRHVPAAFEWDV